MYLVNIKSKMLGLNQTINIIQEKLIHLAATN